MGAHTLLSDDLLLVTRSYLVRKLISVQKLCRSNKCSICYVM